MLDTILKNRNGTDFVDDEGTNVTIRYALFKAIDLPVEGDAQMQPPAKLKLAKLSIKLADDNAELSAGEITILLERAARNLTILIYTQLVQALDPKALTE